MLTDVGHVRLRGGEEQATGRSGFTKSSHSISTLKLVDQVPIVCLNKQTPDTGSQDLRCSVAWNFPPRESSECSQTESDSRVQVSTRDTTGDVDSAHDADSPSERDGQVASLSEV
jgi:hypothetical protein